MTTPKIISKWLERQPEDRREALAQPVSGTSRVVGGLILLLLALPFGIGFPLVFVHEVSQNSADFSEMAILLTVSLIGITGMVVGAWALFWSK